jgi:hypothetical protein
MSVRKLVAGIPVAGFFVLAILLFDWIEYHTRGSTGLLGINPRCLSSSGSFCLKLDIDNLSWDAALATWLSVAGWYLAVAFIALMAVYMMAGAMAGLGFAIHVVRSPPAKRLLLIANNRQLESMSFGLLGLILAGFVALLLWAQLTLVAILLLIPGAVAALLASTWIGGWAGNYRHDQFLAAEARRNSEMNAIKNRLPASLRKLAVVYRFGHVGGIRRTVTNSRAKTKA